MSVNRTCTCGADLTGTTADFCVRCRIAKRTGGVVGPHRPEIAEQLRDHEAAVREQAVNTDDEEVS